MWKMNEKMLDNSSNIDRVVVIDVDDYENLMADSVYFSTLLSFLFEVAYLSYDRKFLQFNEEALSIFLSVIQPLAYKQKLEALQQEALAKDGEADV